MLLFPWCKTNILVHGLFDEWPVHFIQEIQVILQCALIFWFNPKFFLKISEHSNPPFFPLCNLFLSTITASLDLPTCTGDVGETLLSKHSAEKFINHHTLLKILSNVGFQEQQTLPLWGDKAGENKSNFNQSYYLPAEDNPFLNASMKWKGDKHTSKGIQNEIMKVMALQVFRECWFIVLIFALSLSMRSTTL